MLFPHDGYCVYQTDMRNVALGLVFFYALRANEPMMWLRIEIVDDACLRPGA